MCGINGIWNLDRTPVDPGELDRFTDSLSHRGPDGRGIFLDQVHSIGLGHRRLAILDLSEAGRQPMSYADGRFTIVFNGEIYNFIEIRQKLEKRGFRFKSDSDTEVILAAYTQWGQKCQFEFNGMWAFAIWDSKEQTLFLSRDRFGVKPLFFLASERRLIFASELKAFMALSNQHRPEFDDGMIALMGNHEMNQKTILKGVRNLLGGHSLVVTRDTAPRIYRWWETYEHLDPVPRTFEEQVEAYHELFLDACKIRMRSDVPIATALSGGLDSSAILCAMAETDTLMTVGERQSRDWQNAFVLDYTDTSHSERHYAEEVVRATGVNSTYESISRNHNFDKELVGAIFSLEAIQKNDAHLGPWLIYQAMRRAGITVSLDGHGGDEGLAGYHHYPRIGLQSAIWPWKRRRWDDLVDIASGMYSAEVEVGHNMYTISRGAVGKDRISRVMGRKAILGMVKKSPMLFEFLRNTVAARITGGKPFGQSSRDWIKIRKSDPEVVRESDWRNHIRGDVNRALYFDLHYGTLPTILRNFDRDSMAHGVEVRAPFLDWRLVAFSMALPEDSKLGQGYTKRILREAMKSTLPDSIRLRKSKMGFSSPLTEWYQAGLKQFVKDSLNSQEFLESNIWDGRSIRDYTERCYRDNRCADATASWPYIQASILVKEFRARSSQT